MKTHLILLLACICLVQAGPTKKQVYDQEAESYEYEYSRHEPSSLGLLENAHYVEAVPVLASAPLSHIREPPKPGFSVGGPLASIAKGAADQAHTSLRNQHQAAGQAAYQAKNTLAQAAAQSAATAAAALAGKQIVVLGLEQQLRDSHVAVDGEKLQLQQAERAATAAKSTAQQAMHQVQVITAALNAAQSTVDHAAQAAAEAAAELAAQTTMLGQAKARAEAVDEQLSSARLDYDTTQHAAEKAANAAAAAQNNAAAAAAHVADTASSSALLVHAPDNLPPPGRIAEAHDLPHSKLVDHDEISHGSLAEHGGGGLLRTRIPESIGIQHSRIPDSIGLHHGRLAEYAGLHHSAEPLSLGNSLPLDGYEIKGYHY